MNINNLQTFSDFRTFYLDQALQDHKAHLITMCIAIFEQYPDLIAICTRGYTPYFNDGDPCLHSEELALVGTDNTTGYLEEVFTEDPDSEFYTEAANNSWSYRKPKDTRFETALQILQRSDIISSVYDTNYIVKITYDRDTSRISIQQDYYEQY